MKIRPHERVLTLARRAFERTLFKNITIVLGALSVTLAAASAAWAHDVQPSPTPASRVAQSTEVCLEAYQPLKSQGLACRVEGGLWKIKLRDGSTVTTHGPDPAPLAATAAGAAEAVAARNARTPLCPSKNPHGDYYMVAIIAWPSDRVPNETDASFRTRIANINGILYDEAVESGSPNGADFVFDCAKSLFGMKPQVRVHRVALPTKSDDAAFRTISSDLKAMGYNRSNEKYVVYYDDRGARLTGVCGQGELALDERDNFANENNSGGSYAIDYDCGGSTILHELGHTLGAVQLNAPFSSGVLWGLDEAPTVGRHCWEERDVMCYADRGPKIPAGGLVTNCEDRDHFDCRHNDYFDAKIGAGAGVASGSYLDRNWNIGECYVRWIVNHSCAADATDTTAFPDSTVIEIGAYRAGDASRLLGDDNSYFEVSSARLFPDTPTRMTSWYGKFSNVPNSLTDLKITYRGKNSASCTQKVVLWRSTDNGWVNLDSRSVGTTEAEQFVAVSGPGADFVSGTEGNGELRVRISCESSSSFFASGDLLKIQYRTS